jgi:hypothetical protein
VGKYTRLPLPRSLLISIVANQLVQSIRATHAVVVLFNNSGLRQCPPHNWCSGLVNPHAGLFGCPDCVEDMNWLGVLPCSQIALASILPLHRLNVSTLTSASSSLWEDPLLWQSKLVHLDRAHQMNAPVVKHVTEPNRGIPVVSVDDIIFEMIESRVHQQLPDWEHSGRHPSRTCFVPPSVHNEFDLIASRSAV